MLKLSRLIKNFLTTLLLLLMSACGGPAQSSESSKIESSSLQGNDNPSSNSNSTNVSSPQGNDNSSSNSGSTNGSPSKKMTPTFNQTVIDSLYPGWQLGINQIIHFPNHDVIVAGIATGLRNTGYSRAKVIVVQFDSTIGNWLTKWSGDLSTNGFVNFHSVLVTQPNSEETSLSLVTVATGMDLNGAEAIVLSIDNNGTCTLEETLVSNVIFSEQQGNVLIVNGNRKLGMRKISLQGKKYVDSMTPASQLSPVGSVQVAFKLDNDGNVVAAQQMTFNMRVGQTIAFVPADARTKEEFDQGNIEIYIDGGDDNLYEIDEIRSGNSYKFDTNGMVHFILMTHKKWDDTVKNNTKPTPTFIVHVQP